MPSSQDGNLGLYSGYTAGDNGWTAQHNFNWDTLDAMVQATVLSLTTTAPPGSPANGAAYVVPSGATGAWASQTNKIAVWQARTGVSAWQFYSPKNGWMVYNQGDSGEYIYNGSAWALYYSQKLSVPQDYISGLKMVWNSATSISVTTGSAYISSLGRLSLVNSALTLSSLALTASTMYHVYLYENAGVPTIECVTTAPAAAYYGTARAKTGDTSRRYVGSVATDTSGNVLQFIQCGNRINYVLNSGTSNRILNGGTATATTNVSVAGVVPITSSDQIFWGINQSTNAVVRIGNPTAGIVIFGIPAGNTAAAPMSADASQNIDYSFSVAPTGGNAYIDVLGYSYDR